MFKNYNCSRGRGNTQNSNSGGGAWGAEAVCTSSLRMCVQRGWLWMSCNCIARPLCPPASQCQRAVLEVSCRALVCPSAEAQWLWVLWSKCPCGFPLLCFLPFPNSSAFPSPSIATCSSSCPPPATRIRNQLAKKKNLCLLACSKPALVCCDVTLPSPSAPWPASLWP